MLIGSIATDLIFSIAVSADTIKQALDTEQEQSGNYIFKQAHKNTTDKITQSTKEAPIGDQVVQFGDPTLFNLQKRLGSLF